MRSFIWGLVCFILGTVLGIAMYKKSPKFKKLVDKYAEKAEKCGEEAVARGAKFIKDQSNKKEEKTA